MRRRLFSPSGLKVIGYLATFAAGAFSGLWSAETTAARQKAAEQVVFTEERQAFAQDQAENMQMAVPISAQEARQEMKALKAEQPGRFAKK
jgi:demethoxyubiquinone hydroxylase (CLK1/Coq7/Cat5 family)